MATLLSLSQGKGDTSTAGRSVANNILLKSYGEQSSNGPDIPLSAFVVIIKLFQTILNIACGITAGTLPIMGYNCHRQGYHSGGGSDVADNGCGCPDRWAVRRGTPCPASPKICNLKHLRTMAERLPSV